MRMRVYLRGIPSSLCRSIGSGKRLLSQASLKRSVYLLLPSLANQETFHFLFVESSELDDAVANCRLYIGQLHMHRVDYIAHSRNSMYF